jgi:hypothetical protein
MMRRWVWRSVRMHYHTLVFATDFCGYLQSISSNSRFNTHGCQPSSRERYKRKESKENIMYDVLSPLSLTWTSSISDFFSKD